MANTVQKDIPKVKELCELLGFRTSSTRPPHLLTDSTHTWRRKFVTDQDTSGSELREWKSVDTQRSLDNMTLSYLQAGHGDKFWPMQDVASAGEYLVYSKDKERISLLVKQLFWRQNTNEARNFMWYQGRDLLARNKQQITSRTEKKALSHSNSRTPTPSQATKSPGYPPLEENSDPRAPYFSNLQSTPDASDKESSAAQLTHHSIETIQCHSKTNLPISSQERQVVVQDKPEIHSISSDDEESRPPRQHSKIVVLSLGKRSKTSPVSLSDAQAKNLAKPFTKQKFTTKAAHRTKRLGKRDPINRTKDDNSHDPQKAVRSSPRKSNPFNHTASAKGARSIHGIGHEEYAFSSPTAIREQEVSQIHEDFVSPSRTTGLSKMSNPFGDSRSLLSDRSSNPPRSPSANKLVTAVSPELEKYLSMQPMRNRGNKPEDTMATCGHILTPVTSAPLEREELHRKRFISPIAVTPAKRTRFLSAPPEVAISDQDVAQARQLKPLNQQPQKLQNDYTLEHKKHSLPQGHQGRPQSPLQIVPSLVPSNDTAKPASLSYQKPSVGQLETNSNIASTQSLTQLERHKTSSTFETVEQHASENLVFPEATPDEDGSIVGKNASLSPAQKKQDDGQQSSSSLQVTFIITTRTPWSKRSWEGGGLSGKTARGLFEEISRIIHESPIQRIAFTLYTSQGRNKRVISRGEEIQFSWMRAEFVEDIKADMRKYGRFMFQIELEPDPDTFQDFEIEI